MRKPVNKYQLQLQTFYIFLIWFIIIKLFKILFKLHFLDSFKFYFMFA